MVNSKNEIMTPFSALLILDKQTKIICLVTIQNMYERENMPLRRHLQTCLDTLSESLTEDVVTL